MSLWPLHGSVIALDSFHSGLKGGENDLQELVRQSL